MREAFCAARDAVRCEALPSFVLIALARWHSRHNESHKCAACETAIEADTLSRVRMQAWNLSSQGAKRLAARRSGGCALPDGTHLAKEKQATAIRYPIRYIESFFPMYTDFSVCPSQRALPVRYFGWLGDSGVTNGKWRVRPLSRVKARSR